MGGATTESAHSRKMVRGFASIGAGTLVSRVSGFAREVATAAFFGAGTAMDIFVAAFTIPNLFCRVFGESAVESGFMPLFKGLHSGGQKDRAWRLAAHSTMGLGAALLVIVVVGVAAAPLIVGIVASGFRGETAAEAIRMTRIMFPFGLVIGLAALMGAILLAFSRFRVYSLAPVLLNVGIIGAMLLFSRSLGYYSLAVGVLAGGLMQLLVQVPFVHMLAARDGARPFRWALPVRDPDLRRTAGLAGPVILASAISRMGVIVDRTVASFLAPGSISSLYYSFRLVHLPYAIIALAVGRSTAPHLAEEFALGHHEAFRRTLLSGIRMNLAFLAPIVALSVWFAVPACGLVYQHGAFGERDLAMTASAFAMYSLGLVGMGIQFLLVTAFAATLNTKTPVKVSIAALILNAALNVLLVRTPLKHAGVALANSIAFTAHAALLYVLLNRQLAPLGARVLPREFAGPAVRVAAAAAVMLAVVWAVEVPVGMAFAHNLAMNRAARMLLAGGAGVLAYAFACSRLGVSEVRDLLSRRRSTE
jgi:putative peptidoglycan lipid II flippase